MIMTGKMTPSAFNEIIERDIEWIENNVTEVAKSTSLEYDHIISTLRYAAKQYGDNKKRWDELVEPPKE